MNSTARPRSSERTPPFLIPNLPTLDLRDMVTVDYDFLPETTHFFPLEQPEECVSLLRGFLESNGLAHTA